MISEHNQPGYKTRVGQEADRESENPVPFMVGDIKRDVADTHTLESEPDRKRAQKTPTGSAESASGDTLYPLDRLRG